MKSMRPSSAAIFFYDLFSQGRGGGSLPPRPPWIRYYHVPSMSPCFVLLKNGFNADLMAVFTHNIKNIKGASHENGDVDVTCIQASTLTETETETYV